MDVVGLAALALQLAYLVGALGWRAARHWKETGDSGLRLTSKMEPTARLASLLMIGGIVAGLGSSALTAFGHPKIDRSRAGGLLGLGTLASGLLVTLRAQLDLGRSWRVGVDPTERTELITTGSFSMVRNPIFSGMALIAIGSALSGPSVAAALGAAAVIGGIEVQVRKVEEPYLLRIHGKRYASYMQEVGRFVPRLDARLAQRLRVKFAMLQQEAVGD